MIPLAHIAGMPVEETIASLGPALLLTFGAASATLRARLRRARSFASTMPHPQPDHSPALLQERRIARAAHSRREDAEPAAPSRPPHCAREAGASEATPPLSQPTISERLGTQA